MEVFLSQPQPRLAVFIHKQNKQIYVTISSVPPLSETSRSIPKFSKQNLDRSEFQRYWSKGIPIVVTEVNLHGDYGPSYFVQRYGSRRVLLQNCETGATQRKTVAEFFKTFGEPGERTDSSIWKLKVPCKIIISRCCSPYITYD
jgi:hypothetical protein